MIDYELGPGRLIVPPGLRMPRLEQLLGVRLDQLDYPAIQALVGQQTTEDLTLEFKRELYADGGNDELAKDVAAMANAAGGLILLGVDEDEGRAGRLTPVALTDDEQRRMRQVCASRIAPTVRDLTIAGLRDPAEPTIGVFVLLVPASESAPTASPETTPMPGRSATAPLPGGCGNPSWSPAIGTGSPAIVARSTGSTRRGARDWSGWTAGSAAGLLSLRPRLGRGGYLCSGTRCSGPVRGWKARRSGCPPTPCWAATPRSAAGG
jgi:hypothetical protein